MSSRTGCPTDFLLKAQLSQREAECLKGSARRRKVDVIQLMRARKTLRVGLPLAHLEDNGAGAVIAVRRGLRKLHVLGRRSSSSTSKIQPPPTIGFRVRFLAFQHRRGHARRKLGRQAPISNNGGQTNVLKAGQGSDIVDTCIQLECYLGPTRWLFGYICRNGWNLVQDECNRCTFRDTR